MSSSLSLRQAELFYYLLTPLRMKEIAYLMKCSFKTTDTFARTIYKKKNVENRFELIIQFYQEILNQHGISEKSDASLLKLKEIKVLTRANHRDTLER